MKNTIIGIFDDPSAARRALEELRDGQLHVDDVSIISRATETGAPVSSVDDVSAGEGAAVGAVWGGLVGLAALLIPGIGPFVAFGALGAALTGAVTGAVVGGIAAALIDFSGIPEAEAQRYEQQVHQGKTLVAAKVDEADSVAARRIMVGAGAESIRDNQTDLTGGGAAVRVATYDAGGQPVNQALEYGAPTNPTTVDREQRSAVPLEPTANGLEPVIEDTARTAGTIGVGRAAAVEATAPNPQPPETLGVPPATPGGPRVSTPDAPPRPRHEERKPLPSAEQPDSTTPDAPREPELEGPDTNLPRTGERTM